MSLQIDLCTLFVNFYNSEKTKGNTFIPDTVVSKLIFNETYNQFIKQGLITPIEHISIDEKKELVSECREMKDVFYTNEKLIESSKILSVIKLINNQT